jgi:hypothetical protein
MAKRARGASGRPGQRRSTQRSSNRPQPRPQTRPATSAAVGRPASPEGVGEAELTAVDSPAERAAPTARGRTRGPSASFEDSAAQEYAYVAADVRRIALVGGSLFAVLIALFILIEVLGVIHL